MDFLQDHNPDAADALQARIKECGTEWVRRTTVVPRSGHAYVRDNIMQGSVVKILYCFAGKEKIPRFRKMWEDLLDSLPVFSSDLECCTNPTDGTPPRIATVQRDDGRMERKTETIPNILRAIFERTRKLMQLGISPDTTESDWLCNATQLQRMLVTGCMKNYGVKYMAKHAALHWGLVHPVDCLKAQRTHPFARPRLLAMEACDHGHQMFAAMVGKACRKAARKRTYDGMRVHLLSRALAWGAGYVTLQARRSKDTYHGVPEP